MGWALFELIEFRENEIISWVLALVKALSSSGKNALH